FVELAGGEKARLVIVVDTADDATLKKIQTQWESRKPASVAVMAAGNAKLNTTLGAATGVWLTSPAYQTEEFQRLVKRGGVIAGVGKKPATQAAAFLPAMNLAVKTDSEDAAKLAAVGRPGIVIENGTALVVKGRDIRVLGDGKIHVALVAGASRPA